MIQHSIDAPVLTRFAEVKIRRGTAKDAVGILIAYGTRLRRQMRPYCSIYLSVSGVMLTISGAPV